MNTDYLRAHFGRHGIKVIRCNDIIWLDGKRLLRHMQGPYTSVSAAHRAIFNW